MSGMEPMTRRQMLEVRAELRAQIISARKASREPRQTRSRPSTKMIPAVRAAVLELLSAEPLTDSDLIDAYRALETDRAWPPAAAATIRIVRRRLTRSELVAEAGVTIGPTGRQRILWTVAR